jgi:hypothetical protein
VEEVIVTGSRIRTSPLDQAQPIVQIDEALVAKQGLTSTVDVLQRVRRWRAEFQVQQLRQPGQPAGRRRRRRRFC